MKLKNQLLVSALFLGGLLSPHVFAADTVCSVVYLDDGVLDTVEITAANHEQLGGSIPIPQTTISVASNFYAPAIDLATAFLESDSSLAVHGMIGWKLTATAPFPHKPIHK
ncbi:MAG: hypothetical protein LBF50_04505 [Azoarcus sp.]|jgi:hypothetical protein|nr:hypothetical protein [Azoarcus sp.]